MGCLLLPAPQRGSLCGLAVLLDDGRATLVNAHFDAELANLKKDAFRIPARQS